MYTSIEQSPSNVVLKQLFIPLKEKNRKRVRNHLARVKKKRENEEGKDGRSSSQTPPTDIHSPHSLALDQSLWLT
jgi:hypothetical protein